MTGKYNGAIILLTPFSFIREKVFRLKPVLDKHVALIRDLAKSIEVPSHTFTLCYPYSLQVFNLCVNDGRGQIRHIFWIILIFHFVLVQMCKSHLITNFWPLCLDQISLYMHTCKLSVTGKMLYLDFSKCVNNLKCLCLAPSAGWLLEAWGSWDGDHWHWCGHPCACHVPGYGAHHPAAKWHCLWVGHKIKNENISDFHFLTRQEIWVFV